MVSERHTYAAAVTMNNQAAGEGSSAGQTANQNQIQRNDEFDDPLYLHITENPNLVLVSPALSEHNYASWSRSMKMALEVKNKFGFASGSIPKAVENDPKFGVWKRCNNVVCSWLLKSLNSTIAESVLYYELAADIWKILEKRYSQADPHRIAELQNEIFRNVQGNMTINEYFTKSHALWERMNAMRPITLCECLPRCSCTLLSKIQKERVDDQVIRFLEGLSDDYESVKSNVLVMDPIPEMEKVLNMTLKMERKINGSISQRSSDLVQSNVIQNSQNQPTDEHSSVAVSASNTKKKFNGNGGKNVPKCTYCGMIGHTIEKCYKKHGYPPGWVHGYKSKNRQVQEVQQAVSPSINQVGDIGISADQLQRLLSLLQGQSQGNQASQASSNAAVTVSSSGIKPAFRKTSENSSEGSYISNLHVNNVLTSPSVWILDSGATDHITCSLEFFERHQTIHGVFVRLPNGETAKVTHIGEVRLDKNLLLRDVLYIPAFSFNIISVNKLAKQMSCKIIMNGDSCNVQGPHGTVVGFAKEKDGLYLVTEPPVRGKKHYADETCDAQCNRLSLMQWHNRLGHYPINKIHLLKGIKHGYSVKPSDFPCDVCHFAKHKKSTFPVSFSRAERCFYLAHMDVWGPFAIASLKGEYYFLTIVDDHSRFTWLHLMKNKLEVKLLFQNFCQYVHTQFSASIKTVRTDNGTEFLMSNFSNEKGIIHQKSCVYTPQQNGIAERKHQHLLNVARALRFQSGLPMEFWGHCVLHACYTINKLPSPILDGNTPFGILFGKQVIYDQFRTFGCLCYGATIAQGRNKMQQRARKCVFLGIPANVKGYLLYDIIDRDFFVSRDVHFYEQNFPFKEDVAQISSEPLEAEELDPSPLLF
ncbi:PREDICTED: uncharacterized protein LOC109193901 [Ipomoea nil]|uniref:uncharacterized protein LOC109193901 n=1 Tax=Ipomoea nil TaxID=35883 RepID=UPI000900EF4F|nr:PREDICTED: uncharacterized protein LOC109193901 [Ipomoea nil]